MICHLRALDLAHDQRRVHLLDATHTNCVHLLEIHVLEGLQLPGSYGFGIDVFASVELDEIVAFDRLRVVLVQLVDEGASQHVQEVHVRLELAVIDQLVWLILLNSGRFPYLLADDFG